jgi:NADH-quinone oxidoreductase subunit F
MQPDEVIDEVTKSKLRGRGGAGFPTGTKWSIMKRSKADVKYIICNADEGDPGAYMNRNEIESDPHMLIEGMISVLMLWKQISVIIYIRAEYPLAVKRFQLAMQQARNMDCWG